MLPGDNSDNSDTPMQLHRSQVAVAPEVLLGQGGMVNAEEEDARLLMHIEPRSHV